MAFKPVQVHILSMRRDQTRVNASSCCHNFVSKYVAEEFNIHYLTKGERSTMIFGILLTYTELSFIYYFNRYSRHSSAAGKYVLILQIFATK